MVRILSRCIHLSDHHTVHFIIFLIEVWLIYNVILVSGV